jgi:hypothetical protein
MRINVQLPWQNKEICPELTPRLRDAEWVLQKRRVRDYLTQLDMHKVVDPLLILPALPVKGLMHKAKKRKTQALCLAILVNKK